MRRTEIEEQNRSMLKRQRDFRIASDILVDSWGRFEEVAAIGVIGSVSQALWKEVPRFPEFRRAGIEVWHECGNLDMALWLDRRDRLGELRRAASIGLPLPPTEDG